MEGVERIERAIDYIEKHLTEKLDAEDIAKENYMSVSHFQRIYSHLEKTVGKSNMEKLRAVTVEKQEYLIARTEKSALSIQEHLELRKRAVTEWFNTLEYELTDAPEITVIYSDNKEKHKNSYVEIWLPVRER